MGNIENIVMRFISVENPDPTGFIADCVNRIPRAPEASRLATYLLKPSLDRERFQLT
jgi:hypothetical protein